LKPLYDYAWFVGFFASGALYTVLMMGRKKREPGIP
jgi:cytosine/uracil/thiamine/allantoin permease